MKRLIIMFMFFVMTGITLDAKPKPLCVTVSFGFFYTSLNPYGEWIEIDADIIAWRPHSVSWNWRPYSVGRWAWTRHGWYWDSYEPFGWATYHYGRWFYDDYYGWIWIPDYEWGPSWVEWRYDDDYIGWAPLPPYASFRINFGIHFSIGWHSPYSYWNFVPYHRFCDHRVHNYIIDSRRSHRIFEHTKYRTNYYMDRDRIVNGGIDRSLIERRAGYRIAERDIRNTDDYSTYERTRKSRNDGIYSYRPSEREINRNVERFDIKRGEKRTSLEREKITISRGSDREITRDKTGRVIERERSSRDSELSRDINPGREKINPDKREMRNDDNKYEPKESRRELKVNDSRDNVFKREDKSERKSETRVNREKSEERKSYSPRSSEKSSRSTNRSSERRR